MDIRRCIRSHLVPKNPTALVAGRFSPVFVNDSYSKVIKSSAKYEEPKVKVKKEQTVKSKLEKWLKDHGSTLTKRAKSKLQAIIDEIYE